MSGKEREVVHFSLGFGIFQNDDELTNGWIVSAAQAPYQGQIVEEVEDGVGGEAMEGEEVEVMEHQFSEGLHEEDNCPAGQCEMCQESSQHILSLEETNVLEMRQKVRIKQLCASHYSGLLKNYTSFQKFCSDPYKVHTKGIKTDLVVVSVDMYKKNPIFLPGQKVCRKCQTRLGKEEDASGEGGEGGGGGDVGAVEGVDEGGGGGGEGGQWGDLDDSQASASTTHSWSQEYQKVTSLEKVNHALSALDMSPIKRSHLTSGVGMAAKLSKICDGIKTELNVEELCPKTSDSTSLLESMKNQFNRALDRCEKYKILTSLPEDWTEYRISKEFGCSNTMARDALQLRSMYGPGSTPGLKAGHRIPHEVASKVIEFYTAQDVSREMPGKKDCITVREGRTKTIKQKRLLLSNLRPCQI